MQKLHFSSPHYSPEPTPAKSNLPKWYKDSQRYIGNKKQFVPRGTKTIKECSPFLDALTIGYQILLPVDIIVEQKDGFPFFTWGLSTETFVEVRPEDVVGKLPVPKGYSHCFPAFKLKTDFRIPKGRSILLTHPLNRTDLPFLSLSGIVDSGVLHGGSFPFFMQEGFEGLIPQGTPVAQILPFKRESWSLVKEEGLDNVAALHGEKSNAVFSGWYKKNFWVKKDYN